MKKGFLFLPAAFVLAFACDSSENSSSNNNEDGETSESSGSEASENDTPTDTGDSSEIPSAQSTGGDDSENGSDGEASGASSSDKDENGSSRDSTGSEGGGSDASGTDDSSETEDGPAEEDGVSEGEEEGGSETGSEEGPAGDSCTEKYDTDCGDVPDGMVCIPAGEFTMGADEKFDPELDPENENNYDGLAARQVCMPTYYIDKTHVTTQAFTQCVQAGECQASRDDNRTRCNFGRLDRDDHPMNCVNLEQANRYCSWAGKRIPTEAEWEKAARGEDGRTYPWGEEEPTCELAVMREIDGQFGCGWQSTQPVGSKPEGDSPYGVSDMAGNAWDWVQDRYDPSPFNSDEVLDNPQGPEEGDEFVTKGGGFPENAAGGWLRSHRRIGSSPSDIFEGVGFRCASPRPEVE